MILFVNPENDYAFFSKYTPPVFKTYFGILFLFSRIV